MNIVSILNDRKWVIDTILLSINSLDANNYFRTIESVEVADDGLYLDVVADDFYTNHRFIFRLTLAANKSRIIHAQRIG